MNIHSELISSGGLEGEVLPYVTFEGNKHVPRMRCTATGSVFLLDKKDDGAHKEIPGGLNFVPREIAQLIARELIGLLTKKNCTDELEALNILYPGIITVIERDDWWP